MARIVLDARESGTTTGRYVDKLVENLHKLEPEHEFIILTKRERVGHLKSIAPNFKILESSFKEFTFAEQIGFLKQLRALKPDLVHFSMPQQPVWYRGKVVTTIHDLTTTRFRNPAKNQLVFWVKQQVYKWVIKRVARKSVAVITASEFVKQDVAQYARIGPNKITVVYEAADRIIDSPKSVPNLTPGTFIMYVGRPLPHKNLKRLMEAYSIIRNTRAGISLALVGAPDKLYERHAKWAQAERVEGLVFTGFASEGQLRWLYENTLAYVFPSLSEGFGLPGLEAMAHGAPVISSKATCLPEIYGQAAEYFDPVSVRDMVRVIGNVLANPARRQQLRQLGAAQARKYSWRETARQTLDVYRRAISE